MAVFNKRIICTDIDAISVAYLLQELDPNIPFKPARLPRGLLIYIVVEGKLFWEIIEAEELMMIGNSI